MSLSIRAATADDADLIAWVEVEAARSHRPLGFWDVALPGPDRPRLDLIAQVVVSSGEPCFAHFDGFLVGELDGVPVGALSGYDPTRKPLAHFLAVLDAVLERNAWSEAHRALLWQRLSPMARCTSDSPDDRWVVEFVALRPEARGKGIAARLVEAILQRGRDAGFSKAQISYLIGNTPARLTYQRAGFVDVDEKRDPEFEATFGSPGVVRMWMDL